MIIRILFLILFAAGLFIKSSTGQSINNTTPFSTDSTNITMWNGEKYVPLFIKGINLGVAIPGTFPGEMAASSQDYARWFTLIREAGFNTIRLYTLHFPRFYDELKKYNEANPQYPLFFFQGIWLEEEIPNYNHNLFMLTSYIDKETTENISALHGNITIPERLGKAYGTYTSDVSKWMIGYILGREIHPIEVLYTNQVNSQLNKFEGTYLSIQNTNPSEAWLLERLDKLLIYEQTNYNTQRPVSVSSWPTLDPLDHPLEPNPDEDTASIDLSGTNTDLAKAGFFISYHAYPYYPDFISITPEYKVFSDYLGQNSYLGYLTYLKKHYLKFPLIIAEYGVPSSWGIAHYAHSGMNHGGYDEYTQGLLDIRMLENNFSAKCGGGIQFSWIDEWFKRTWITDKLDFDPERRILWCNTTAAEQNFGLIGFKKPDEPYYILQSFCDTCKIKTIEVKTDFSYLMLKLKIQKHILESDTIWISLDTYRADLGESILPNGKTVNNRAEFALMITNNNAQLFVTEAYDMFGNYHGISSPQQLYHSIPTDGAPWNLVRWKNNTDEPSVQYIGNLLVNRLNLPKTTLDGVRLYNDSIIVRLPYTLLNIVDPSQKRVMHDYRNTPEPETMLSDGIAFSIYYKNFTGHTSSRYLWENWNHALNAVEYKKESYHVIKEKIKDLPGNPIAFTDYYELETGKMNNITIDLGLLKNDLSLDGSTMEAVIERNPKNGYLNLNSDGSFIYYPNDGFTGNDTFLYKLKAGYHWSEFATVNIKVTGSPVGEGFVKIFPNPSSGIFSIDSKTIIDYIEIYNSSGILLDSKQINAMEGNINISAAARGTYFVIFYSGNEKITKKIVKI